MGVHIRNEYQVYSCSNCGLELERTRGFSTLIFPLKFGPKIIKCHGCDKKFISSINNEFWDMNIGALLLTLIFNFISWSFISFVIMGMFEIEAYNIFLIIFLSINVLYYSISALISYKRLHNKEYVEDLFRYGALSKSNVTAFINKGYITKEKVAEIVNSNLNKEKSKIVRNYSNIETIREKILNENVLNYDFEDNYFIISKGFIILKDRENEIHELLSIKNCNSNSNTYSGPISREETHLLTIQFDDGVEYKYNYKNDENARDKARNSIENLKKSFVSNIKEVQTITCKVCGKEIPYNEYGTCEECHKKILERIKKKEEQAMAEDSNTEKNDADESIQTSESIFCTNCGKEIEPDWKFCKHCGKEIK